MSLRLRDLFRVGKDVTNAFKDIAIHDDSIKNNLTQAGGLISLIGIGLELYQKYQEYQYDKRSNEEKAFASLVKFVFQITVDLLKDVKDKEENKLCTKNSEYDWTAIEGELLKPFEENSDWNSYLPNHPAVRNFRSKIIIYLKEQHYDAQKVTEFKFKFNLFLERNAATDPTLKEFNEYSAILQQYKDLVRYLEHLEAMKGYPLNLDGKHLSEYYVDHHAVFTKISDTWSLGDEEIKEKYLKDVRDVNEVIENELLNQNDRWYLVVGASFGIGKTSMARIIASRYASNYLNETEDPTKYKSDTYIPILVFLKDGLKVEYKQYSLDDVFEKIIAPENNEEARKKEVLIILDGLDEYENDIKLMDKLDEIHRKYPNIKAIITTRLEAEVLALQKIKVDSYIRLLQFTGEQVDAFFDKYGVRLEGVQLTYRYARELNLPVEEMTKPLFAWIFSFLQMYTDPELKIETKKHWTETMRRSWIYMLFFHHVIKGKYKDTLGDSWKESYINEKKTLRKIAALKQIYGENLLKKTVEEDLGKFGSITDTSLIPSSYFFYFRSTSKGKIIDFMHKTFREYLLAEYYLESLLENKTHRLNIRMPTVETLRFLNGLIGLLLETKDNIVKKYIEKEESSLLKSFGYDRDQIGAIKEIKETTSTCINEASIILLNTGNNVKETKETETIWRRIDISTEDYQHFYIHQWISLYILNELDHTKIEKEKLTNLIRLSSTLVSGYFKQLSKVDLRETDLRGADLSGANLRGAILTGSNLTGANLSGAQLQNATLEGAYINGADLYRANLRGANLGGARLRASNLENAVLIQANLTSADLEGAYIIGADLSGADLRGADLRGAMFSPSPIDRRPMYTNLATLKKMFEEEIRKICNGSIYNENVEHIPESNGTTTSPS